jgi:membrane-associated phospholipid phosphatase
LTDQLLIADEVGCILRAGIVEHLQDSGICTSRAPRAFVGCLRQAGTGTKMEANMRMPITAVLVLFTTLAPSYGDTSNAIEPQAGAWKTFVISSGSELRAPRPPDAAASVEEIGRLKEFAKERDPAALDLIAYWDTGAPSYRWNEIAVSEALRSNLSVNYASRLLALLHVAMHDALIATWDSKYAYNRRHPSEADATLSSVLSNPRSPSYPAEHAAAAGAAAAVLSYLFPDRAPLFAKHAEEATRSRLLAGVSYPSDIAAGLEIGRRVAAKVIERGKGDESDAKWTGSVPVGLGKWTGTNPILPMAATWKPWVLASPGEFRPAPPMAHDSPERAAEIAELKAYQRTPKTNADAFFWEYAVGGLRNYQYWNAHVGRLHFEHRLDANPPRAARAYALQSVALYDAAIACWDGKYAYWLLRPVQLDPDVKPLFPTPNHPSYPAAHGCLSFAAAISLGHLFPRDAAALAALADEANKSRIWAGIHYRSDAVAGAALGRAVANKVVETMRAGESQ